MPFAACQTKTTVILTRDWFSTELRQYLPQTPHIIPGGRFRVADHADGARSDASHEAGSTSFLQFARGSSKKEAGCSFFVRPGVLDLGETLIVGVAGDGTKPLVAADRQYRGDQCSQLPEGLPAAGSIGTIFCTGLSVKGVVSAAGLPLPNSLAGTTVTIGGAAAPLFAVADLGG